MCISAEQEMQGIASDFICLVVAVKSFPLAVKESDLMSGPATQL